MVSRRRRREKKGGKEETGFLTFKALIHYIYNLTVPTYHSLDLTVLYYFISETIGLLIDS